MGSKTLQVLAGFGLLVAGVVLAFEGPGLGKQLGLIEKDEVLVFVIPDLENARRVRRAISKERIVWEGSAGIALLGGRVVALDLDSAAEVIESAEWVDRPIRIVRLDPREQRGDTPEAGSDEARLAKLRSLVNKPMLTGAEQMFVLMAMNDGLEI